MVRFRAFDGELR